MAKDNKWIRSKIKRKMWTGFEDAIDGTAQTVYFGEVRHRREKVYFGAQKHRSLLRQISNVVNDKIE